MHTNQVVLVYPEGSFMGKIQFALRIFNHGVPFMQFFVGRYPYPLFSYSYIQYTHLACCGLQYLLLSSFCSDCCLLCVIMAMLLWQHQTLSLLLTILFLILFSSGIFCLRVGVTLGSSHWWSSTTPTCRQYFHHVGT